MLIRGIGDQIKRRRIWGFIKPSYRDYCLSNLPSTILKFFNIKTKRPTLPKSLIKNIDLSGISKVVLLLFDALNYDSWKRICMNYKFFNDITRKGTVVPITSVFPSSTAPALATISTGLTPQEHTLIEWYMYIEEIDAIIETIPLKPIENRTLNIKPQILFKGKTVCQQLKKEGIKSFSFRSSLYASSLYTQRVNKGSKIVPFVNLSDLVVNLRKLVENERGHVYFNVYWDRLDSLQHKYGVNSEEKEVEISALSYLLLKNFVRKLSKDAAKETLLVIVADHGQIKITSKTIYLNYHKRLIENLRVGGRMKRILPVGGMRDVFLFVKADRVEKTKEILEEKLRGKAKIVESKVAVKHELFGVSRIRKKLYNRVDDIIILPYNNYTVWYEYEKKKSPNFTVSTEV